MQVEYRQLFLKDLKGLKKQPIYQRVFDLAFETLPNAEDLQNISNVKAMKGYPNRYRIRIGDPVVDNSAKSPASTPARSPGAIEEGARRGIEQGVEEGVKDALRDLF